MKKLIIILASISILLSDTNTDSLFGSWKSEPKSKDKFTCNFREGNQFTLTGINRIYNISTNGTFSLKKDHNKSLLHLYDLSFYFARNIHYGGLLEFIDKNTFKLDLRNSSTDKKLNYPTEFGPNTIVFLRQNENFRYK